MRPLYAYKPRRRRVGQPSAGARQCGAKTRHKGGPSRAHTTEAYLKLPLRHLPRRLVARRPLDRMARRRLPVRQEEHAPRSTDSIAWPR